MTPAEKIDRGETLAAMWEGFAETVVLPHVPKGSPLYSNARDAFYAGALCLFNWFTTQMDPGEEPTDDDMARVEAMHDEIHEYMAQRRKGPVQ